MLSSLSKLVMENSSMGKFSWGLLTQLKTNRAGDQISPV